MACFASELDIWEPSENKMHVSSQVVAVAFNEEDGALRCERIDCF